MGAAARSNPFGAWKRDGGARHTEAYDCAGRLIGPGDMVHVFNKQDVMWRVVKTKPILNGPPNQPPLVEVTMVATFITPVPGGMPLGDCVKVMDASDFPDHLQVPREPGQEEEVPAGAPARETEGDPPTDESEAPAGPSRIILP